jgi:hypothetical protein
MTAMRRRQWSFLVLATFFYAFRGLGRSDDGHIQAAQPLISVLGWIGWWEIARTIRRERLLPNFVSGRAIALLLTVLLAWRYQAVPSDPRALWSELQQAPTDEDLGLIPDPAILRHVPENEYLWPIERGILNYSNRRHNPIRHAIAYCVGSPNEQRQAVADLERHPTPVIAWAWSGVDDVDPLVRQYILAEYVLRNYRPSADCSRSGERLLFRQEANWPGLRELPEIGACAYGHLPRVWGTRLWPIWAERIVSEQPLGDWQCRDAETGGSAWETRVALDPRSWNYLRIEWTCRHDDAHSKSHQATLEFSPGDLYDEASKIDFEVVTDGRPHTYLVPISCHPAWSWRPQIARLRLRSEWSLDQPLVTVYELEQRRR